MTMSSEGNATAGHAPDLATILSKLDPAEIEIDSLGRIIVKSAELREALLMAAETTPDGGTPPTNGSGCQPNSSGCRPNGSACRPT
jgi:hypothetical protein